VNGFKKLSTIELKPYRTYTKFALGELFVAHQLANCYVNLIITYKKHKVFLPSLC
jgi:hypothetical protein